MGTFHPWSPKVFNPLFQKPFSMIFIYCQRVDVLNLMLQSYTFTMPILMIVMKVKWWFQGFKCCILLLMHKWFHGQFKWKFEKRKSSWMFNESKRGYKPKLWILKWIKMKCFELLLMMFYKFKVILWYYDTNVLKVPWDWLSTECSKKRWDSVRES